MSKGEGTERTILFLKPSGRKYYLLIAGAFLLLSAGLFYGLYDRWLSAQDFAKLEFFLLITTLLAFLLTMFYFQTAYIKVENESVLVRRGILIRTSMMIPFNKIDNIQTKATLLDAVLGLQTIMIDTSGTDEIELTMDNLPSAKVKEFLDYYKEWKRSGEE